MKKRSPQSIDGFTVRRRQDTAKSDRLGIDSLPVPEQFLHNSPTLVRPGEQRDIAQTADTSPSQVQNPMQQNSPPPPPPSSKKSFKERFLRRPEWLTGKRLLIGLAVLVVLIFGYIAARFIMAGMNSFEGNLFDIFSTRRLKSDEFGRTNVVIFGTSEDSVAHQAEGGDGLTDSIQVLSVNQDTKDAVMFSVPRDLWVNYGMSCISGYEGKINVVYECGRDGSTKEAGAKRLMEVVGETFALEMHYYVNVNFQAVEDAVDAVGGITVTIDSDDPRGIYDPNFDWQCGHQCELVRHENGPAKLNGEEALALARARNAAGGYGLAGGNFDREANQQKIMLAIKDKAVSAGTLSNPVKLTNLVDSFGDNVRTNFVMGEIRTLARLASEIGPNSIKRLSLVDVEKPVMTTGDYFGQSIVMPTAGIGNFSEVRSYIRQALTNTVTSDENADISVLNATDTPGVAANWQEELSTKGVIVSEVGDAPTGVVGTEVRWYDLSGGQMPETAKLLEKVLGRGSSGTTLPGGVQSGADFVILAGDGTT